MSQKTFEENLHLFSLHSPQVAVMLPYAQTEHLAFANKKKNLKTRVNGKEVFFYPSEDPLKESKKWFKSLDLKEQQVLYVFGIGLGYDYEAAKHWLKKSPSHTLVFLEDDLGVLYRFLETDQATKILQDPQVIVHYFSDWRSEDKGFERLTWRFIQKPFAFSSLRFYASHRAEDDQAIRHKIAYDSSIKNDSIDEYLKFGIAFFRSFYPNLLHLPKAYWGNALFEKFRNIPAIICGAGPSLNKNRELLKKLQTKALIFAGGSALNALLANGIIPHFGAGIDPNPLQRDRFLSQKKHPLPVFYRNRIHHLALNAIKGPKLYINGAGGYDIAEWFEKELGIEGKAIDEGYNVVNFCCEIAYALGCRPIIFVGMDLAFTENKTYAEGVMKKTKAATSLSSLTSDPDTISYHDTSGKPILTQWKWIAEAEWISKFAKEHPDVDLINATEGGLGIEGVPNLTLKQVESRYLKKRYPLEVKVIKAIQKAKIPNVTDEKVWDAILKLKESLKNAERLLDVLLDENQRLHKQMKKTKKIPSVSGIAALAEIDLEEEPAYQAILKVFNTIHQHIFHPQRRNERDVYEEKKQEFALQHKRFIFLKHVVQANLLLIKLCRRSRRKSS